VSNPATTSIQLAKSPIGHQSILAKLFSLVQQDKLHQAILLSGPSGIGKILVAIKVAQSLMCESLNPAGVPCQDCRGCRMTISSNHPDLFLFDPSITEQSSVEAFRELLRNLNLTSLVGGKKVVLIDNADQMSISTANIFLKGLEEPRPNTHFILVSSNPYKLPITIRSRVQEWRLGKLTKEQVREVLSEKTGRMDFEKIISLCDGSVTAANDLIENSELISDLIQFVTDVVSGESAKSFVFVSKIAKDKDQLRIILPILTRVIRLKMIGLVSNTETNDPDSIDVCSRISGFLDDCISAEYAILERNFNPLLVLNDIVARALGVGVDKGLSGTSAATSLNSYY
jgi:DNA polymerase III gamma/tau subunit